MKHAIIPSNTAITVENAANDIKRKKRLPQSCPPAILLKILGSVTNIRLGPLSALTPNAEHAGKIMRPANIATNVSSIQTLIDSPKSDCSFPI